jgi:S1-C subfamily serine protease
MQVRRAALAVGTALALMPGAVDAQSSPNGLHLTEIYRRVAPSTVMIRATFEAKETGEIVSEEGSGFVINDRGFVITARHVVTTDDQPVCAKAGCRVTVTGRIGSRAASEIAMDQIELQDTADVAILRFGTLPPDPPHGVPVGSPIAMSVGDPLVALGFPGGFNNLQPKPGTLLDPNGPRGNWVTDMPLNPGESGGPVLDSAGNVVGLVGGGYKDANGLTFVVPLYLADVSRLLQRAGSDRTESATPGGTVSASSAPGGAAGSAAPGGAATGSAAPRGATAEGGPRNCLPPQFNVSKPIGEWMIMRNLAATQATSAPSRSYTTRLHVAKAECGIRCMTGEDVATIEFAVSEDGERIVKADTACQGDSCNTVEYDGPEIVEGGTRVTLGVRSRLGPVDVRLTAKVAQSTQGMVRVKAMGGPLHYGEPFVATMPDAGGPTLVLRMPYGTLELTSYTLAIALRPQWLQQIGEPVRGDGDTAYTLKFEAPGCPR